MTRIVVRTPLGRAQVLNALASLPNVDVDVVDSVEALSAAMVHADVVLMTGAFDAYTEQVAAAARASRTLRWIHLLSMGREAFEQFGVAEHIQLTGPGGVVSDCVAEHAIALLWALARQLPAAMHQQEQRVWSRAISPGIVKLTGATLLVVGLGSIGTAVARLAGRLGMRVIGVNRSGQAPAAGDSGLSEIHRIDTLPALLPHADAVVIALPARAGTACLFDANAFAQCRQGALFVNVGRGMTVDHDALVDALRDGAPGAAALDVTDPEPLPADHPLWSLSNVILTPHVGGAGDPSAFTRMADAFAANVIRFQRGEPLDNLIR